MTNPPLADEQAMSAEEIRAITWLWWALLLVGLLSIVVGVIVILKPSDSLAALAVMVGVFILIDSIFQLVSAFLPGGSGALGVVISIVGLIIGILLIRHPVKGVTAVALLIGIWLVALGAVRLARAFTPGDRLWNIIVGLIELVFGLVIVSSPHIGYTTLAIVLGIGLILNGVGLLALGGTMRAARSAAATAT